MDNEEQVIMNDADTIFCNHIKRLSNEKDSVSKYIFSGLSSDRNYNNKLTKEIFKKHFYVEFDKSLQVRYREKINDLFKQTSCGILGIRAHGGSGKTTAIEMISLELDEHCEINRYSIAFLADDIHYSGAINRINTFCRKKFLKKINQNPSIVDCIRNNIQKVLDILSRNNADSETLINLWSMIKAHTLNELLKENSLTSIFKDHNKDNTIDGLKIALLFLSILIISDHICTSEADKHFDRYLVVFDNIEFVTTSPIGDTIHDCWTFLSAVFENNNELYKLFNKIKFAVCARTTTGLKARQSNIGTWGDDDKFILDIESGNFCAEALLKKLYYLHKNNIKGTFYNTTELICQLICGINNTENYLKYGYVIPANKDLENEDPEYTYFAKKYFSPFFGNDFRLLASTICSCLLDPQNTIAVKKIKDLLKESSSSHNLYEFSINGARNILWHLIFKRLNMKHDFEYFGIQPIDAANKSHSSARIILSYMYWHKMRHLISNNCNEESYPGIGINRLATNVLSYFYSESDIAQTIYRLSNLSSHDNDHHYTYFITIDDHTVAEFLRSEMLPPSKFDNIQLKLSPAGICYVHHVSTNFEFFSARDISNVNMPLMMYTSANDPESNVFKTLNNIYLRVSDFIAGMIMNCKDGCTKFRQQKIKVCSYDRASNNSLNNLDIFYCNLCVRLMQAHATIISIIDYIDRYRLYLVTKETNEQIKSATNINLLNLIEKFAKLFYSTKAKVNFPDNKFYNFLQSIIYPKYNTKENGTKLEELGLYQTLKNSRLLYYTKNKNIDYIFEAIAHERDNTNPVQDLYKVCEELEKENKS